MTFPAYPNYKSTGVEWLSEIPVHWELIRLRFLLLDGAEGIKIGPFGSQLTSDMLVEVGYKVYGQENVIAGDFDKGRRYITDEKFSEMSVYEIRPNDLLVTMMGTAGRCKVVPEAISAGVMDSHLLRMRFGRKADPKFVELLIDKSNYVSHQVRLNGKGSIMHGLNSSIIKELLVALPSADEQASILSFLDHETARIDALIEEQQRLIELLKEKRQALISHAVTKGLDPTVPMKDSGVEWLGEVPAHWEVTKLGWILNELTYGFTNPMPTEDDGPAMLTANDIGWGTVLYEQARSTSEIAFREMLTDKSRPKAGDLLLTKDGTLGRVAVHDGRPACINQSVALIRPDTRIMSSEFLCSLLQASCYQTKMIFDAGGTTIKHIYITILAKMNLAVPSLDEQQALLNFISSETCKFDRLTSEAEQVVNLLQERRSALISAAVTGKIDVRGWQPPASTQAPELAVAEAV
ncbi:restriction endonuclease subunit S [uncultured Pseudomonas sp.]|uniref:restriction endonuclease subunit S n=1 Tax=uncultured Pseudomonas sp. TaxID=114707 RepID=UPI0025E7DB01|nr:restriction endonuclease subunit S [uncultured Pseudomonas sp.]